jgi:hypothetical protein
VLTRFTSSAVIDPSNDDLPDLGGHTVVCVVTHRGRNTAMGMKAQLAQNAAVGLLVIGVVSANAGSGDTTANSDGSADRFSACANSRGTSVERSAALVGRTHDEWGRVTVHNSSGEVLDTRAY